MKKTNLLAALLRALSLGETACSALIYSRTKPRTHRHLKISLRYYSPFIAVLLLATLSVHAGLVFTIENPGVQASSVPAVITETFDKAPLGAFSGPILGGIGTLSPGGAVHSADAYGGAGGSQYYAVGAQSGSTSATLTLSTPQTYFGMWWPAGDAENQLLFFDGPNLLGSYRVADIVPFLSPAYFGNPNNGFDSGEPFVYLNFTTTGNSRITSVQFLNDSTVTGYEMDNLSVSDQPIEHPPGYLPSTCVKVAVYSGFGSSGGGSPYSGLVGTLKSSSVSFASTSGYNWHPFALPDFGADITGTLDVAETGDYTFSLNSDDGSVLLIDNTVVINNGNAHGPGVRTGSATLTKGLHSLEVQFFECCGGESGVDLVLPKGVSYSCEPALCSLSCPEDITQCNDAGDCGAVVNYPAPVTSTSCGAVTCTPPSGSLFPKGTTQVICKTESGNSCSFSVTVTDCEPPVLQYLPTTNPAGSTVPASQVRPASGAGSAGFFQLLASDNCDGANLQIYVKDSAEGPWGGAFSAGPFAPGTKVKLTKSPGHAGVQPMAGAVAAHIHTQGDPVLVVTDSSGNATRQVCPLP